MHAFPGAHQSQRAARFGFTGQAIFYWFKRFGVTSQKSIRVPKGRHRCPGHQKIARREKLGRPIAKRHPRSSGIARTTLIYYLVALLEQS